MGIGFYLSGDYVVFILFWLDRFFRETLNSETALDRELKKRRSQTVDTSE